MNFEESESYSPMKNNVIEQVSRINEIIKNAKTFKTHYNDLMNNIIDSVNVQCASYEKNSKKAIRNEIYEGVINSLNWEGLQSQLVTDLKSNKVFTEESKWIGYGSMDDYEIEEYDTDPIVSMYSNYSETDVKEYARYQKEAVNGLYELVDRIGEFESELIEYKSNAIKTILEKNIPVLYEAHFKYVKDLMHKKKNVKEDVIINGIAIKLNKSQKTFFTNSLKRLIVQQK